MMRENIEALQHELSRRAFFKKTIRRPASVFFGIALETGCSAKAPLT